jgi:hypothetical protein
MLVGNDGASVAKSTGASFSRELEATLQLFVMTTTPLFSSNRKSCLPAGMVSSLKLAVLWDGTSSRWIYPQNILGFWD